MSTNPYNDPTRAQPPQVLPPMEALQPRQVAMPQTPVNDGLVRQNDEEETVEARQDEARTVIFAISKLKDFVFWFLMVLEVTLLVRFVFRLIAADPANTFAGFLYTLTGIVLLPFIGIVKTPSLNNWAFEWPTLIAMAIYALIFLAVGSFLRLLVSSPKEATE